MIKLAQYLTLALINYHLMNLKVDFFEKYLLFGPGNQG